MRIKNSRSWGEEFISGLRLAAWTLLAISTFVLLVGGAAGAFSRIPNKKGLGWVALTAGAVILVYTLQRWVKLLPGFLFLATVNALVMAKTGHLTNNPFVQIPRQVALGGALLFAASCVLSMQFHDRRLTLVDRMALLSYVACVLWGMLSDFILTPLILGVIILVLAWANHHIGRRRTAASAGK